MANTNSGKILNTRIALKRDTVANWNNKSSFVPLVGEVVVHSGTNNPANWDLKVGDGSTNIANLKFLTEGLATSTELNAAIGEIEAKIGNPLNFVGVVSSNADLPTTADLGDCYKVGVAGTYDGKTCQVGDMLIWGKDADGTEGWMVIQTNITGATFAGTKETIATIPAHNAITGVTSTFKGTTANIAHNFTPSGNVTIAWTDNDHTVTTKNHAHSFTGTQGTVTVTGTSAGSVAIEDVKGTINNHTHTFTGTGANHKHSFTGYNNHTHTFTGAEATIESSYTPNGTIAYANATVSGSITSTFTGEAGDVSVVGNYSGNTGSVTQGGTVAITVGGTSGTAYTPAGTVASHNHTITVTPSTTTDKFVNAWNAGSLPSRDSVSNMARNVTSGYDNTTYSTIPLVTISWANQAIYNMTGVGTLPSLTTNSATVVTGIASTASGSVAPTFTGTASNIAATFTGKAHTHTIAITNMASNGTFTPAGDVNSTFSLYANHKHGFTGTAGTATATYTPSGTVGYTNVKITNNTNEATVTPAGTIAETALTWTYGSGNATFTGANHSATGTFTPAGTISNAPMNFATAVSNHTLPTATFAGNQLNVGYSYTPAGTITHTYTWNNTSSQSISYTPKGNITLTTTE